MIATRIGIHQSPFRDIQARKVVPTSTENVVECVYSSLSRAFAFRFSPLGSVYRGYPCGCIGPFSLASLVPRYPDDAQTTALTGTFKHQITHNDILRTRKIANGDI